MKRVCKFSMGAMMLMATIASAGTDIESKVEHKFADSNGVKIHYASLGKGPLVVFIHGFPDYWYSWRNQMDALSSDYQTVALDLRGYNESDKPKGVENYAMPLLVGDVAAVIKNEGKDKAIIVGHDWGGAIAWQFAMNLPQMTEKLIICNLPHPRGIARELATNPDQQKNSAYARNFQKPDSHTTLQPRMLAGFLAKGDEAILEKYTEAFEKSDLDAMMNYYRANYPKEPYQEDTSPVVKVKMPVLMFHGLQDSALHHHGLNNTWEWVEQDLTIVTVPNANHWVHHDAPDLVSNTMKCWLQMRK